MAFRIGDKIHTHADARVDLTPHEGVNAGLHFTVRACSSMSIEMGGKTIVLMGNQILPVAIALGSAEPSFSLGLDVAQVSLDAAVFAGNGYARMAWDVSVTMNRPGLPPITWLIGNTIYEKGFGMKSDSGGSPKDEFSGKMTSLHVKYKGITLDPFALPGGVTLV